MIWSCDHTFQYQLQILNISSQDRCISFHSCIIIYIKVDYKSKDVELALDEDS